MYKKTTLSNGLRIITHGILQRDSVAIGLWVGVGGRYEADKIKGAAHFLEHMVFKGSQKYACEEIKTLIEGVGGTLNAFTSEEQTCYYAKIPHQHLAQTFDVLADMVLLPRLQAKDVAKEKGVIVEEIKMYRDLPQYHVLELLDELLWPGHPLGKSLAGTQETVVQMQAKDLKDFHRLHYAPENIVVAVCGRFSHQQLIKMANRKLGTIKARPEQSFIKAKNLESKARVHFFKKDIEQMHLALGSLGYGEKHKDRYILTLLSVILGGNMSSRLFVEVREKRGLAYSISCSAKSLKDTGMFLVRAGVENKNVVKATDVILKEFRKIGKQGVGRKEFRNARDYVLGQLMLHLEDTMEHMLWLGESLISRGKTRSLKSVIDAFKKITSKDIQRVARDVLAVKKFNCAVIGPLKKSQEAQLRSLLRIK